MYVDGTMPSLATAMDNNKYAITDDAVTNDMYFLDLDADPVVVANDPFFLDVEVIFNPDKKETWFYLPGVIVALILTGTAVVREKENHTLEQLIVSPVSAVKIICGNLLPYMLIAFTDFYIVLVLSATFFDLPVPHPAQWPLFLLAVDYVSGLIGLGVAISTLARLNSRRSFFLSFS